jgi:ABC-type oligopeptide transport system ATPase subunit
MQNVKYEAVVETGEIVEREMTADELAADKLHRETVAAQKAAEAVVKAEAEAARQALLDKLGITADEAKLLLG